MRNIRYFGYFMVIVVGLSLTLASAASAKAPYDRQWQLVWSDEFNVGSLDTSRWSVTKDDGKHPNWRQYTELGVSFRTGSLNLVSRRHCETGPEVVPTAASYHPGVCPTGTYTNYSSGRIETTPQFSGPFRVVFRAKLTPNAPSGLRNALWLKNEQDYCVAGSETDTGEFDVMEWYSAQKRNSSADTHIGCKDGQFSSSHRVAYHKKDWSQSWHTWSVEFVYPYITYFVDGKPVKVHKQDRYSDSSSSFSGRTIADFNRVVSQKWRIVINNEVFLDPHAASKAFRAPDATTAFSDQRFLVDYVRVYAPGKSPW